MPSLSLGKLASLLKAPPPAVVFYLHGDEAHLRDETERRITSAFLDPATQDFNLDQLRGADVSAETIGSIAGTPPMMASHRVVVIRDAQGLTAKAREVVEAVASAPPEGLVMILSAQVPAGTKAKFYSTLQQRALSIEFAPVDPLDLPGWLIEHASETHSLELRLDAARAMVASVGGQLGILTSEIRKLADYIDGRSTITLEDVRAVGGYIPRVDRWAWFDLVMEKKFSEALSKLPELIGSETGVGLVIGISTQLVRVGLVVAGGREALERELKGFQRWQGNKVGSAAKLWSAQDVDAAIEELLRTDRLLKSASLTDRQAIEELLLRLAERAGARQHAA